MVSRQKQYCSFIGLCLGIIGIIFAIFCEKMFYKNLEKDLVINTKSLIYEVWHKPPMNVILDFYIFNWTNPQDFRNPNIKPKFEELGPYRFMTTTEKVNIEWHPENASVSYRKKDFYHFSPNDSNGSLDDIITTINSVAITISTISQQFSLMKRRLAEMGMMVYPRDLTVKKTVDELLFKGYSDTLLTFLNLLPKSSIEMPFDKYGYCYGRNDTSKFFGSYNVHTGADDIQKVGQMHTWNQQIHNELYPFKCSKIRGSGGEFLGPYLKPEGSINMFLREFCRDIPLEFDSITDLEGIRGFKYIGGVEALDNGTINPENECLCNGECLPSGVVNISSCWFNAPVFASFPHFYKADPYYLNQIDGLNPQKEKHEFQFIIDPKTSIGLDLLARFQMNILVKPITTSRMFHDVRKVMFPLFWAEVRTRMTPELLDIFRHAANVIFYGQIIGSIISTCGFILAIYCMIFNRKERNTIDNDKKINHTSSYFDSDRNEKTTTRSSSQPLLAR